MPPEIGPFVVDVETGHVFKSGKIMKWGGKTSQLFCLLLENSPQTTSKDMIMQVVWKGRIVTENTLYKTIGKLRAELNKVDIEVESVFGEGYRLITSDAPDSLHSAELSSLDTSANRLRTKKPRSKKPISKYIGLLVVLTLIVGVSSWAYVRHNSNSLMNQMTELDNHLAITKQAFISQINRRNELGELLSERFELKSEYSWEKRFYQLYEQMNEQERFLCGQSRAYTEGPLLKSNQAIFDIVNDNPKLAAALPASQELISHLTIWLNKYEKVFKDSMRMCLLYVGVEDGAHYPSEFDGQVKDWIEANR